ncbi:putative RNA-directed DNA polymerase [Helianthus debilis subsp. tardiflorus]
MGDDKKNENQIAPGIINYASVLRIPVKLDSSNWSSWSLFVQKGLASVDKEDHLTKPPPDPTPREWRIDDSGIQMALWNSMEPQILTIAQNFPTVKAMWDHLSSSFSAKESLSHAYSVVQAFTRAEQGDSTFTDYFTRFSKLQDELRALFPPTADLKVQEERNTKMDVMMFIAGLSPKYASARPLLLSNSTAISSVASTYHLLREMYGPDASPTDVSALVSKGTGQSSYMKKGTGRGTGGHGGNLVCHLCHEPGHARYNCPNNCHNCPNRAPGSQPKARLASTGESSPTGACSNPTTGTTYALSEEDLSRLQQLLASQSPAPSPQASLVNSGILSYLDLSWIIDSGATHHMTGIQDLLSSLRTGSHPPVRLADGSSCPVRGIGSVSNSKDLNLSSVLLVPKFPDNLCSVSQITKQNNCSVTFYPTHCIFQELGTNRLIGIGFESGGLYRMSLPSHPKANICDSSIREAHYRLGHPSAAVLRQMRPDFPSSFDFHCESCQLGTHTRRPYPPRVSNRVSTLFELLHSDVWGPCPTKSTLGFQYFITFIDDYSRATWVYLLKSRAEIYSIFREFHAYVKTQFQTSIKTLRTDNAKEYLSTDFSFYLKTNGIIHESSCVYTPQQNGVAERKNRHLLDITRTLMIHSHVPHRFWGDAVLTAAYLINRMPSPVIHGQTPFSILFPKGTMFPLPPKIFGCVAYVHDHRPGTPKLDARAIRCIFVGYSRVQKGYRCYSPSLRRYFTSSDVTFHEECPFFPTSSTPVSDPFPEPDLPESPFIPVVPLSSVPSTPPVSDTTVPTSADSGLPTDPPPLLFTYARRGKKSTTETLDSQPASTSGTSTVPPPNTEPVSPLPETVAYDPPGAPYPDIPIAFRKEPRHTTRYPIQDYVAYAHLSTESHAFTTSLDSYPIPKNVMTALAHPGWHQAMEEELGALRTNHTWDLVTLPPGKRVVGCRWVFTVKLNPDGSLHRLKARLVAKGYSQAYGIDYDETFSPVAKMPSVRICIALAAIHHWPLHQLDVKNAFLNGVLEEEVYMEQPPGFIVEEEASKVCRLRRSLYGLKQSPRAWFGRFSSVMGEFGMVRSAYDHSVFFRHHQDRRIILVVYVDDIIITGDDEVGITKLKQFLQSQFQISDLGRLRYFLGIEVSRSPQGILLSQRKYVLDMLTECGLLGCKPVDCPMLPTRKLLPEDGSPLKDPERYRRLVGKLNYLTVTRPDISFVVSVLSQFMATPYTGHWDAALRVLRYLKNTPGLGILYSDQGHCRVGAFTEDGDGRISGFSDADWAGCPISRRSTTGYCVFVGGNLVSWKSKKQHIVSRSSAESEYRAMADVTSEMIWVRRLLRELGVTSDDLMRLYCDNQSAIHIAKNQVFHERTKHIEVDCHLIRDRIVGTQKDPPSIQPIHVKTEFQLADIFTKPLRKVQIDFICSKLGMINIYAPT